MGITPAYAGTTVFHTTPAVYPQDHPRLRGNYRTWNGSFIVDSGSPPLTRELPKNGAVFFEPMGITPAYAGTTLTKTHGCTFHRDHPRLRGNYLPPALRRFLILGSPPLTRELRYLDLVLVLVSGITPAYAGTTAIQSGSGGYGQDHPRLRGNYAVGHFFKREISGSPPLTRELRKSGHNYLSCDGITPAYAGTTFNSVSLLPRSKDHPRLRGNYMKRKLKN